MRSSHAFADCRRSLLHLLLGEVRMPTKAPLQYVYSNGKPVSVIVPIEVWEEQPSNLRVEQRAVEHQLAEELLVDVVCTARVRSEAALSPADITSVLDWQPLEAPDLRPFRTDAISWSGRSLRLRQRITCAVSREDGLVIIEYEALGIRAYAETRESAIRDFAEEFVVLWDEYAVAADEGLTPDAVGLKLQLLALVDAETTGDENQEDP